LVGHVFVDQCGAGVERLEVVDGLVGHVLGRSPRIDSSRNGVSVTTARLSAVRSNWPPPSDPSSSSTSRFPRRRT
jgi:hypothetical protein